MNMHKYENGNPDFSNAEKGDLIWNDAYGLGEVKGINRPGECIILHFKGIHTICFFDGKYAPDSPKPTFFYSDGKGNNYLTKRPEQKIDFSILKPGTRLKTAGGALVYFVSYMPISHPPVCVAGHKHVDGVYSNTRFLPVSAIVRVEED